jgi:hypothetical protein
MAQKPVKARRFDRTVITAPIERIDTAGFMTLSVLTDFLTECALFGVSVDTMTVQIHWNRDAYDGGPGLEVVVDEKRPHLAPPEREGGTR